MLGYVYGHDAAVARFVAQRIPNALALDFEEGVRAIGVVDDGLLIAGIAYHNWDPDAGVIEISGAALPGRVWITRETLRRSYQYPFHQCGCQMVVQRTHASDERLLSELARLNYAFILVPRMYGRDSDGVLCCLTYEAWADNKFCRKYGHHVRDDRSQEAA